MELNKIHLADCMDIMKDMPDNYIDLAVVDPPYGIGESGGKSRTKKNRPNSHLSKHKHEKKEWDIKPNKEYFDELFRISKNQIIWGANYLSTLINKDSSCWIVWDKNIGGDQADCDLAWASFKTAIRKFTGHPFIGTKGGLTRIHPTQKPVVLYRWILQNYAKEKDLIFDSHSGSGSLAIACIEEGFNYIACELDPDYHRASIERIQPYLDQGKLF